MRLHDTSPLTAALAPLSKRERDALAFELGFDSVTIWRWATGRSIPSSHATRVAIAEALGQTVESLWPTDAEKAAA